MKEVMFRISERTHDRLKRLKEYAKNQGFNITMKSIAEEAVNCMPEVFFKKIRK